MVVGSNPTGRTRIKKVICITFLFTGARRSHVSVVTETGEPGSWNFAHDGVQNIPDHTNLKIRIYADFSLLMRGGAIFGASPNREARSGNFARDDE